jgi:hypothetical protein
MFKATILALAGLIAVASTATIEIPTEQWLAITPKESTIKMQLYGKRLGSTASNVQWGECDSQHLYDVATGTANPNPPIVGNNVALNLDVIFNNDANVVGNYIYVLFTAQGSSSPITLYAQEFPSATPG